MRRSFDAAQTRAGRVTWESPDILPLGGWLMRTWEEIAYREPAGTPVLLDSRQEEALWEEQIRASRSDDPLLNVSQTAVAAMAAWDLLHRWQCDAGRDRFEGLEDTEAFFDWTHRVREKLRANGWITQSELYREITAKILRHEIEVPAVSHAGFEDTAPADRRLLQALKSGEVSRPMVAATSVRRFELHDPTAEWVHAAAWARESIERDPSVRIGVAIPGLHHVSASAERIFDEALHPCYLRNASTSRRAFEMPGGGRLSETPLVASALLLLRLTDQLTLPEALSLLRSPYVALTSEAQIEIARDLRRQGIDRVSIHTEGIGRAFPGLAQEAMAIPRSQQPLRWSATFSSLLRAAEWGKNKALVEDEHVALRQWKDLLSDFARLGTVLPVLTLPQALDRVRRIASTTNVSPVDVDAPVQLMDLADLDGTTFDALWISGLEAGTWPRSVQPNPFLPVRVQRELGMPRSSPELEYAAATRRTIEWRNSAKDVVFSSPRESRDGTLLPSPLIAEIPDTDSIRDLSDTKTRVFTSGALLEELPLGRGTELAKDLAHSGGVRILENQAACPFKAFATHRLGASELGEVPFGVSRMERGNVAHEALHILWDELRERAALYGPPDEVDAAVVSAIEKALDKTLARRQQSSGMRQFRALEGVRLKRLISEWLKHDSKRPPFRVLQTEVKEEVPIGGMRLHVRADRIDEFENSTRAIVDYKTGKAPLKATQWEGSRLEQPQLPLYAVTHTGADVSQIGFARLVLGETKWISAAVNEKKLAEWKRTLEALAGQYLAGYADVDPLKPTTCNLCRIGPLCRIAEQDRGTGEDNANE